MPINRQYKDNYSYISINTYVNPTYVERRKLLSYSYLSNLNYVYRRYYSNSLIDGDVTQLVNSQNEKELKRIAQLFPHPRETLNNLNAKTPEKVFDIHYKQNVVAPKGVRKKMGLSNSDWTFMYLFRLRVVEPLGPVTNVLGDSVVLGYVKYAGKMGMLSPEHLTVR
ncbi:hypothetical protein RR46_00436 [Papilio xuthus]|uniref:Uncharacterized protein n=1 Tax=Papilio xuthus TaxID=66420 RepID=A0A0N1PEW9_PAPXU|nr:hypothetical protein RR46_00436 [Papilio xuthus]